MAPVTNMYRFIFGNAVVGYGFVNLWVKLSEFGSVGFKKTGDVKIFKDRAVDVSNTYRYKIQAVLEESVTSKMSDVVEVMY